VPEAALRPVWAEIDLGAVRHNVGVLRRVTGTDVCAVVKADAYGHGAVAVARAAIEGGAKWLGVAVIEEGVELRRVGIGAPVLVLSEPSPAGMQEAAVHDLSIAVYTKAGIEAAEAAAAKLGKILDVHLKIDSGMHRVGADPGDVLSLAQLVNGFAHLRLGSVWTHLAVADGLEDEDRLFTEAQIHIYDEALALLAASGIEVPMRHAANSAGAIAHRSSRYDLVRCGIALYGELPVPGFAQYLDEVGEHLIPVMSLKANVGLVRRLSAGERPSYGRKRALPTDSTVVVAPIGYADGFPRALFDRQGTVLVGGRRRPLAGTVTMDQIIIDCGAEGDVAVGDEVVLIGRQGEASLSASDWAETLGTISYEVLCGIGPRVHRVVVDHSRAEESMDAGGESVVIPR